MGLAATYNAIDDFKIQHQTINYVYSYQSLVADIKTKASKKKIFIRRLGQIFNQTMENK